MKNKKKIVLIICIVIITGICIGLLFKNNNKVDEPCDNCEIEFKEDKTKNIKINYSGKIKKYNAYDFIIEKMEQAQYWTYDQYEPIYNTVKNHYSPSKEHMIKNGTGWTLFDEDTASFTRGFEGRLIINFSENTATSHSLFYMPDYDDSDFSLFNEPTNEVFTFFDYTSGKEYFNGVGGAKAENSIRSEYDLLWDEYNEIKRTINFYNDLFSDLGIPLLNMPKGTLASYKNKIINVPIELIELKYYDRYQDDLIHSPFDERVGWSWHWEKEENIWLKDYRDVFNQRFPESTENELVDMIDIDNTNIKINEFAPVFLCLTNTMWSDAYDKEEGLTGTEFYNFAGAFETYYLKPLYEQIFGFNGVYFYDESKMQNFKDRDNVYGIAYRSIDDFNNKFYLANNEVGEIVFIYDKGDKPIGQSEQMAIAVWGFENVISSMNKICDHYNIKSQFGEDFPTQLSLIYNIEEQKALGIR